MIGILLIPKLSIRLNPSANLPSVSINYTWTGASAYTVEREVTSVLESGFSTLTGLKKVTSKSSNGFGNITLDFKKQINQDLIRFEVSTITRQLYSQLPNRVTYPSISINGSEDIEKTSFMTYTVNSSDSSYEIASTIRNRIEPVLGSIKGIDRLVISGAKPKEYTISFNNSVLKSLNLSKSILVEKIKQALLRFKLGQIVEKENYLSFIIQPKEVDDWHLPIDNVNNRIIYLDELAIINEKEQKSRFTYRVNGNNAITISLYAKKNANTIELAENIESVLFSGKSLLPKNYEVTQVYDSTDYLKGELDKLYTRFLLTLTVLFIFILIISRSIKYLALILLSLTANLGIAFIFFYIFQIQIQIYSLAGITISLGIIMDNTIVIVDHILKRKNKKLFIPILASTLTSIGALIIIFFLDDVYKVNLVDFALVIIINLLVSLLVVWFMIPALIKKLKITKSKKKLFKVNLNSWFYRYYEYLLGMLIKKKLIMVLIVIILFGIPFFLLPTNLENNDTWYEKTYNSTFGNSWFQKNIRPSLDRYLGGSLRLFTFYVFNDASYKNKEETKLVVTAFLEKESTYEQINEVIKTVEDYIKDFDEIGHFTSYIDNNGYARIEILFNNNFREYDFPLILKDDLVSHVLKYKGIEWNIKGVGKSFNNSLGYNEPTNFSIKATGYKYDELNTWADSLKIELSNHPRIDKVVVRGNSYFPSKPSFEYVFALDREKIVLSKISPSSLFKEIRNITISNSSDLILNVKGNNTPIRFINQNEEEIDIWNIQNTPLDSLSRPIVLNDKASVLKRRQEEDIDKENQEYVRLIEFQYSGTAIYGLNFLQKKLKEQSLKLPIGYKFEHFDRQWSEKSSTINYVFLITLIALIIYFICAVLFESYSQPLIILTIVPISFIGVFLTFYLFKFSFDQGGFASFVLLSGLTVNASIFIIDSYNRLKKEYVNLDEFKVYLLAFKERIYPILLTIISTILGFIPFIINGQNEVFWFTLAVGTIGGLFFSLIGILFYLPLFIVSKN